MNGFSITRRIIVAGGAALALGACSIIPKSADPGRTSQPTPEPTPSADVLPTDEARHRVALLVPLSGDNGAVGQSIANATTMALLDTEAENLRITTYDTARGPQDAARRAIADGNRLILGPLLGSNVVSVRAEARAADVPIVSFSNDNSVAGENVFVMGNIPEQSIWRSMGYARQRGDRDYAVLAPDGEYGDRAEAAVRAFVADNGGRLVAVERYSRGNTSIVSAAQRLRTRGGFDAVVVADGGRLSVQAASELKPGGRGDMQIIGTELWSGESSVIRASALSGAIFSAVSDQRYRRFVDSYEARFGSQPYRISTLGYDAVLLTLRIARDWRDGRDFPARELLSDEGFIGLDGAFRFERDGVVERAMEVREVRSGEVVTVDAAPARF